MVRTIRGNVAHKRRKKNFILAKGYTCSNSKLSTMIQEQLKQSFYFSYISRRLKKRISRRLWISRINTACKIRNNIYSNFIGNLRKMFILIDRKMLSFLAFNDLSSFNFIETFSNPNYLYNKVIN
jgi:large subunit ribosomal protein L20